MMDDMALLMNSMWRVGAIVAVLNALVACNQSPVETKRWLAETACLSRALAEQGLLDLDASGEPVDRNEADQIASGDDAIALPSFRFVSTGNFVIDYGVVILKKPAMGFRLICTGDFNAGVLKTIQIDGKLLRPKPAEPWRF
jgi:hypothetical protein